MTMIKYKQTCVNLAQIVMAQKFGTPLYKISGDSSEGAFSKMVKQALYCSIIDI